MRLFVYPMIAFLFCFAGSAAPAVEAGDISGNPAVLPSGLIMIGGHEVALWGIDPLANDQQCWHDNRAWGCGEEAITILRHFLAGNAARCVVKADSGGGKPSAQCFRVKNGKESDIARYLVSQGLARDRQAESGGLYAPDQEEARRNRRGIWTSKFQSAEDWKNGMPNYVEYEMVSPKTHAPAGSQARPASGGAPDKSQ